jgi:hypothetical protein
VTPRWRHGRHERFARATASWPDVTPSAEANDPALAGELAVLTMLERNAAAADPAPEARTRMRNRVLAALATLTKEPAAVPRERRVQSARGRFAVALGAAFCLVVALAGMTMLLSRNALPGDPLYGLRKSVESASLDLTVGDDSRGYKYLGYAADRIGDIESLAARYPDGASNPDTPAGDYLTAFADFDSDASAGSGDLTGYASQNGPQALSTLRTWAGTQSGRIAALLPKLPAEAEARATASRDLLRRIGTRAGALLARNSCYSVTSGAADDLGPLPATGPCDHAPGTATPTPPPAGSPGTGEPSIRPFTGVTGTASPTMDAMVLPESAQTPTMFDIDNAVVPPSPVAGGVPVPPGPPVLTLPLPFTLGDLPPLLPGLPTLQLGDGTK